MWHGYCMFVSAMIEEGLEFIVDIFGSFLSTYYHMCSNFHGVKLLCFLRIESHK